MLWTQNNRVLVIDDNPSIQEDFRKILGGIPRDTSLHDKEVLLFGESTSHAADHSFEVESALQGTEGIELVMQAGREGRPYALAFVDIRMPPGMDGVETIERMWMLDPELQFVICSAYSDYTAVDIVERFGVSDRLLLLRKPCDSADILLLAVALCKKWNLAHKLRTNPNVLHSQGEST